MSAEIKNEMFKLLLIDCACCIRCGVKPSVFLMCLDRSYFLFLKIMLLMYEMQSLAGFRDLSVCVHRLEFCTES